MRRPPLAMLLAALATLAALASAGGPSPLAAREGGRDGAAPASPAPAATPAAIIYRCDFSSERWQRDWGLRRADPHLAVVSRDPELGFEPLRGPALRVRVDEGGHYGTSLEYRFARHGLEEPEEIYVRYCLRLARDWDPARGGKLPGIAGTYGRAGWGGRPVDGQNGWSARGLFRGLSGGRTPIGFYCYHADMKGRYGSEWLWEREGLGRLENDRWYSIEQYVKLNAPGRRDGVLRGWVDGRLAFEKRDVRFRDVDSLRIEMVWLDVYLGGTWTARSRHHLYIDEVAISRSPIGPYRARREEAGAAPEGRWKLDPRGPVIPAPRDPALWSEFRQRLLEWRAAERRRLDYTGALYRRADLAWAARDFSCCFLMLCDETFWDRRAGRYRVAELLERGRREFGGYDSVVLWHAYPRIGLDERNQFDFYRDQPGGIAGLRGAIAELHAGGVKAFLDYNPWDTGTRREARSDADLLAELVRELDADGVFLDTLDRAAEELRAKLHAARPGVVLESELALPLERVRDHPLSWAQWFRDGEVPGVLRNKWFEPRHLQHQIKRWNHDHSGELQAAWMNGSGVLVWENVFGSWVGWSRRDRSTLRSMLPVQRRFAALFTSEGWTPLVPTAAGRVYASAWEGKGLRLWTLVNRAGEERRGRLIDVALQPGESLFDLVAGRRLGPDGESAIPARGIGGLLAARPEALGEDFDRFLASQAALARRASPDPSSPARTTRLVPIERTSEFEGAPAGMIEIPGASVVLRSRLRVRECGFYDSTPPPDLGHRDMYRFRLLETKRKVALRRFAIDATEVTNAEYRAFLEASGYRPRHARNFLKHWREGRPPPGREEHPVVWVDLEDARAYARWAGKRLPTEEEWQYAAEGPEGRKYPWGDAMEPGRSNGGETGSTTPVREFPGGRSPFGVYDQCGNVWEWTESERSDGHTRFAILKGGSWYTARGSGWYMDGGPRPSAFGAKVLLEWPGLDRSSTVGFRCVVDLKPEH